MQVSGEARWFGRGEAPHELKIWFHAETGGSFAFGPGGGSERTDIYLLGREGELGIKSREGKVGLEIKGLVDVFSVQLRLGHPPGQAQLWTKWTSEVLRLDGLPTVKTVKTRWLRKFDTSGTEPKEIALGAGKSREDPLRQDERPAVGCNVELTRISTIGEVWWTFGLESFAVDRASETIPLVERSLSQTIEKLSSFADLDLGEARYSSYPEWLRRG